MLSACRMSTYQPQPGIEGEPSRSQLQKEGTLHLAVMTVPDEAAWMAVPFGTPRSTPLCVGRPAVRNPETMSAVTGTIQPAADSSPENVQRRSVAGPTTARAAPAATLLTISAASGSCLA